MFNSEFFVIGHLVVVFCECCRIAVGFLVKIVGFSILDNLITLDSIFIVEFCLISVLIVIFLLGFKINFRERVI